MLLGLALQEPGTERQNKGRCGSGGACGRRVDFRERTQRQTAAEQGIERLHMARKKIAIRQTPSAAPHEDAVGRLPVS
ncbi:hypothetical protein GCM10016234_26670 [Tianweitania populi]|uniref:Uncharacterized protein n=1 Tax=Tianweitania populi TaxID=1607949 RepID=A0A8J3GLG2_9HYPH|nr:hypothetical protein GCM10016234_26670 [Tianweitania populi]